MGIECGDGRMLVLDCAEGPGDEAFLKRVATRYNGFADAVAAVRVLLHNDTCHYCGRDNTESETGCSADDCPGVRLLKRLEKGL